MPLRALPGQSILWDAGWGMRGHRDTAWSPIFAARGAKLDWCIHC